jgi:4-hydroxy-tetrahydrodipicolinate synthase
MPSSRLSGIVPPVATPLQEDESIDRRALSHFLDHLISVGVHGLWVLGTTGRFDMVTDSAQREVAEITAETARGRLPLVLNVSDGGLKRTIERAKRFDDLPYNTYAVLPPWYLKLSAAETVDFFRALADTLSKPIVIYNAPWVCNQLGFADLRKLAEHPRVVGCKDVTDDLARPLDWPVAERRDMGFDYLMGCDLLADAAKAGADGFVTSLSNAIPELSVAIWEAVREGASSRAFELQARAHRAAAIIARGPGLSGLEALCCKRGFFERMLPRPWRSLSAAEASQILSDLSSQDLGLD